MIKNLTFLSLVLLCMLAKLSAQEESKEVLGLQLDGYVDAYWQTKFTDNESPVQDRAFYTDSETFAIGNINLTLQKEFGDFGAVAQFGFGPRSEAANDSDFSEIQQLFIYWNATDKIKLTFGEFGTFIGYEVIDAPANFHYSTSNLFQNGPFFHTGLKSDFDLGKGFGLMLGIFNETDKINDFDSDGRHINGGIQLSKTGDNGNIFLNFIYGGAGTEVVDPNLGTVETEIDRGQLDLVADKTLGKTYLALNASYQFIDFDDMDFDSASWWGVAGYAQYTFSDLVSSGIRLEYMDDSDEWIGSWGQDGNVFAATLSAPITKYDFRFIPEIRADFANNEVFNGDKAQFTLGAALIYSF